MPVSFFFLFLFRAMDITDQYQTRCRLQKLFISVRGIFVFLPEMLLPTENSNNCAFFSFLRTDF